MRYYLIGLLLCLLSISCNSTEQRINSEMTSGVPGRVSSNDTIPRELVCMVNDKFMGERQIPVHIQGVTYYGCCKMCEEQLLEDVNLRYALDPYSRNKVNKAHAIIGITGDEGAVSYFESRENYQRFLSGKNQ